MSGIKWTAAATVACLVAACGSPQTTVDTAAQQTAFGDYSLQLQKCVTDADGSMAYAEACWAKTNAQFCGDGGALAGHCGDGAM